MDGPTWIPATSKDDIGVIVTNHSSSATAAALTQVIAHEAAHMFGLKHVVADTQLMYPYAAPTRLSFTPSSAVAMIDKDDIDGDGDTSEILAVPNGGSQESHTVLAANLGLKSGSKIQEGSTYLDEFLKFFNFDFFTLSTTYYNAKVYALSPDGEGDLAIDIGHIAPGQIKKVELPICRPKT